MRTELLNRTLATQNQTCRTELKLGQSTEPNPVYYLLPTYYLLLLFASHAGFVRIVPGRLCSGFHAQRAGTSRWQEMII